MSLPQHQHNADVPAHALDFAALGYPVLPLHSIGDNGKCTCGRSSCDSAGKHPFAPLAPNGYKNASSDRYRILSWFDRFPWLNYGVCTEPLPTIDIDPRHNGDKSWRALLQGSSDIVSWRVATGGGGEHIICRLAGKPIAGRDLAQGVELKASGGFIVGVGSMHQSGQRYRWQEGCSPHDLDLAPLPDWLRPKRVRRTGAPHHNAEIGDLIAPPPHGLRHAHAKRLLGHVFSPHPDPRVLYRLVLSHIHLTWDREDLDDEEILKIAQYIRTKERQKAEL
jgi:hypothetical protein